VVVTGAAGGGFRGERHAVLRAAAQTAVDMPALQPVAAVPAAPEPAAQAADLIDATLERLAANAPELHRDVLRLALNAREAAAVKGLVHKNELLTVIDYSLPSTAKRLWVFDVPTGDVLFHELVAHGKNTGDNFARHFSNRDGSLQTSLGVFVTGRTYVGHNGYSLQLDGLEPTNDQALRRAVVVHGAPYVSAEFAAQHGRLGRSWGCPALSQQAAAKVIDTIKGGSLVFSYFPDPTWLQSSRFLASAATVAAR
jgi:hypothetical protein